MEKLRIFFVLSGMILVFAPAFGQETLAAKTQAFNNAWVPSNANGSGGIHARFPLSPGGWPTSQNFLQDSPPAALQTSHTLSGITVSYGPVDYPRVLGGKAAGMNKKGQIIGIFPNAAGDGCTTGYLLTGNSFRKIAYPGTESCPLAINDLGEIAGDYSTDGWKTYHVFSLVGKTFSPVPDPPGAVLTTLGGVDDLGNIVGAYGDSSRTVHGFIYSNGVFTVIDVPGASYTYVQSTSPNGTILVGDYIGTDGRDHGFHLQSGVFTTVDYPGATDTLLAGVNDTGDYVGNWGNGTVIQDYLEYNGFLFKSGSYVPLNLPWAGVSVTWPAAVNDKDQIAGFYLDSNGVASGFYAAAK